jgi:hypothetical protein
MGSASKQERPSLAFPATIKDYSVDVIGDLEEQKN